MIITKETDYALRVLRALQDGEKHTVGELAQNELIPQQFAYKILKKLANRGLIRIFRGAGGGCSLAADLSRATLYDVMEAMEESGELIACMDPGYQCPWRAAHGECTLHCRLAQIQQPLNEELRRYSLQDILSPLPM